MSPAAADEHSNKALFEAYERALSAVTLGWPADYDWVKRPNPLHISWMPYGFMLDEFPSEIANAINSLNRYVQSLSAWNEVLRPLATKQKFDAIVELIEPVAIVAMNSPYVIRSRFIFGATHLSHQANRALHKDNWQDDLPLDKEITFKHFDAYCRPWKNYVALKRSLEAISGNDFRDATNDFRNKYNHRFSPHIEVGLSGLVKREPSKSGGFRYAFGEDPPLLIADMVSLLEEQLGRSKRSYDVFKALVAEQLECIASNNPA